VRSDAGQKHQCVIFYRAKVGKGQRVEGRDKRVVLCSGKEGNRGLKVGGLAIDFGLSFRQLDEERTKGERETKSPRDPKKTTTKTNCWALNCWVEGQKRRNEQSLAAYTNGELKTG